MHFENCESLRHGTVLETSLVAFRVISSMWSLYDLVVDNDHTKWKPSSLDDYEYPSDA